jgi:hypothetical protein
MVDTGNGDKSNADNDLYLPQTDSFWEVSGKFLFQLSIEFLRDRSENIVAW